jgi:hypothetical protein
VCNSVLKALLPDQMCILLPPKCVFCACLFDGTCLHRVFTVAESEQDPEARDEGETEEQRLRERGRLLNASVREKPQDLQQWFDLAAFQDTLLARCAARANLNTVWPVNNWMAMDRMVVPPSSNMIALVQTLRQLLGLLMMVRCTNCAS